MDDCTITRVFARCLETACRGSQQHSRWLARLGHGLEAKCFKIYSQRPRTLKIPVKNELAQDSGKYHDFVIATQHPVSSLALLRLILQDEMHPYLEPSATSQRAGLQGFMLAFIYFAYHTMALLLETVPDFTDTRIECLGGPCRGSRSRDACHPERCE